MNVKVKRLAHGVFSISQRRGGHAHAFLIDDEETKSLTLVDTLYLTDGVPVIEQIELMDGNPEDLRHIVITHAHRSHLGSALALRERTGAEVYAHAWERDIIEGHRKAQPVTIIPKRPFRTYLPFQFFTAIGVGKHPPCKVDHEIHQGDKVGPLHVLHTPGHSPGHLAFYWPERRVVLCGDAIVSWPKFAAGWPAFHLNVKQQQQSVWDLAGLDIDIAGFGHGDPIGSGASRGIRDLADRIRR